ncbi:30S ribosomal protein S6 [Candidatus Falkowbacteria bacterium]|nr:30S ribosomal protein S6 [Candidatus Falkowbacteria bacterium]
MQHYELCFIAPIKFLDEALQKIVSQVHEQIKKFSGEITSEANLGKQRLAYPINQVHQGTYIALEFNMEPEQMKLLDNQLKLTPEVLRHLIIKKQVKTEAEKAREARIQEGLRREKKEELTKMEEAIKAPIKKAEEGEEKKEEKILPQKSSLEDLDKKLDELLKDDII